LKARAIENQCYLIASNQGGWHSEKIRTWGESCIISPWGEVLARKSEGEGIVVADIDLTEIDTLRNKMPVLDHKKF